MGARMAAPSELLPVPRQADRSSESRAERCWAVGRHFFFQAEDGIRDLTVTGVQTCALPISLQATGLAKSYRSRQVVRDLSLELERGEVVGLLGPNGAGKTTAFYMIVGLVPCDEIGRASCRERV